MELLGVVGHVKSRFGPFEDSFSVGARLVHGLRQTYHRLRNRFGRTRWFSKVTMLKWKLIAVQLVMMLNLMQDRCTVCAEHTVRSKIILYAPDGTFR
jgi:hypothetical protein